MVSLLKRAAPSTPYVPVIVPTLMEADPHFAALVAKRDDLDKRRVEIEREIKKVRNGTAPVALADARNKRAAALLGDLGDNKASALPPTQADLRARLAELNQELGDIDRAQQMLATKVEQGRNAASQTACNRVREAYGEAIKRVAAALARAIEEHRELNRIQEELELGDVRWRGSLPEPQSLVVFLGSVYADANSTPVAQKFIADAIAAGIVTPHEIEKANG